MNSAEDADCECDSASNYTCDDCEGIDDALATPKDNTP
jgi:hypothetical protein